MNSADIFFPYRLARVTTLEYSLIIEGVIRHCGGIGVSMEGNRGFSSRFRERIDRPQIHDTENHFRCLSFNPTGMPAHEKQDFEESFSEVSWAREEHLSYAIEKSAGE